MIALAHVLRSEAHVLTSEASAAKQEKCEAYGNTRYAICNETREKRSLSKHEMSES